MVVRKEISIATIKFEISDCKDLAEKYNWKISPIDEEKMFFIVTMISPIDQETYQYEIKFDNYKEIPLLIDFIELDTKKKGTTKAYPKCKGRAAGFFHGTPCICNPISRKAYKSEGGPHADWNMNSWMQNKKASTLFNLRNVLKAIYIRISNRDLYDGRMGLWILIFKSNVNRLIRLITYYI